MIGVSTFCLSNIQVVEILSPSKNWVKYQLQGTNMVHLCSYSLSPFGIANHRFFTQMITAGWLPTNFLNRQKINRKMLLWQDSILNVLCHLVRWMLNKDFWEYWTVNEIPLDWKIFNYHRRTHWSTTWQVTAVMGMFVPSCVFISHYQVFQWIAPYLGLH